MNIDRWKLIPKEADMTWTVGYLDPFHKPKKDYEDPFDPPPTYWFAGYGEEGERRWVKNYNDAMTFPSKEEATKTEDDLHTSSTFIQGTGILPKNNR